MLGIVSEQTPKGGALTLNAIAGIGMLTVGIIGGPFIGYFQESSANQAIAEQMPEIHQSVTEQKSYLLGDYVAVNNQKLAALPEEQLEQAKAIQGQATQASLARVTLFPAIMLFSYLGLYLWFRSKGGYRPKVIGDSHA